MKSFRFAHTALALYLAMGCHGGDDDQTVGVSQSLVGNLDVRRSLIVTEESILSRFGFERVMAQLAAQSGAKGLTGLKMFRQLWDTQNRKPGLRLGPHCDDTPDPTRPGHGLANGYPYDCRPAPAEGKLAASDPFKSYGTNPDAFMPTALVNRFDLAPTSGAHCGEYRIIYAKRSGHPVTNVNDRNLIIFEAIMENPTPSAGLQGCRPIAQFWADLSAEVDPAVRAARLESFYFYGSATARPVVHITHFGDNSLNAGQLRTNQFMQPTTLATRIWTLREFKMKRRCAAANCSIQFLPATDKTNPFGPLFSGANARGPKFLKWFPTQVPTLAVNDINGFGYAVPNAVNTGQSHAQGTENDYVAQFAGPGAAELRSAIQAKLFEIGSTLTPEQIVARAQALSCAGCHRLNNRPTGTPDIGGGLSWPAPLGFAHVSEERDPADPGRFRISPALTDVFLPARARILETFLAGVFVPPPPYTVPIIDPIDDPFPLPEEFVTVGTSTDGTVVIDDGTAVPGAGGPGAIIEPLDPTVSDSITGASSDDWTADGVQTLSGRLTH